MGAMREILFRGRRSWGNKDWVEGDLLHGYSDHVSITKRLMGIESCQVEPETVGQYTGLCDKNGKKIFEGDIIHGFGGNFAVRWSPEICSFVAGEGRGIRPAMTYGTMKSFEVIGNIYDNPKLVEG